MPYLRKRAAGKSLMEAMRCLKRRLSDVVYRQLVADQKRQRLTPEAGPGGQPGATTESSTAGFNPDKGASDKSLPGLTNTDATPTRHSGTDPETTLLQALSG